MRKLIINKIKEIQEAKKEQNRFPITATKFEVQSAILDLFRNEFDQMVEEEVILIGDTINDKYIVILE